MSVSVSVSVVRIHESNKQQTTSTFIQHCQRKAGLSFETKQLKQIKLRMPSKETTISRQAQLLQITQWLYHINADDTLLFLERVAAELLNEPSISRLITLLLLKNHDILSNCNVDNLLQYCNSITTTTATSDSKTQTLLSLPLDIFDSSACYLTKMDSIQLGTCCHQLYQITQRCQFLQNNNENSAGVRLGVRNFQKILHCKVDPWSWCVNCKRLQLYNFKVPRGTSAGYKKENSVILSRMVKSIKSKKYYTQWFDKLFEKLDYLTIKNGNKDFSPFCELVTMKTLFSIEKLNKISNKIEMVQRNGLNLTLNTNFVDDAIHFAQKYHDFFVNNCNSDLSKIRKINMLEFTFVSQLGINKTCDLLSKNYQQLVCHCQLNIESIDHLNRIIHSNVRRLQITNIRFEEAAMFKQCQKLAIEIDDKVSKQGLNARFSMLDIANDVLNGLTPYWIQSLLTQEEISIFKNRVNDMMGIGVFDDTRRQQVFMQAEEWFGELRGAITFFDEFKEIDPLQMIFYKIVNQWCLEIVNVENDSNCNQSMNSDANVKELAIGSLNKEDNVCVNYYRKDNSKKRNTNINQNVFASTQTVASNHETRSDMLFYNFNKCFCNSLCYKLLNWQNSVERLTFSFWTNIFDAKTNTQWSKKENQFSLSSECYQCFFYFYKIWFKRAMDNMMKYFDQLQQLSISILFDTSIIAPNDRLDAINSKNDYRYTISNWIDLFCDVFNEHFETLKGKRKNGDNDHFLFDIEFVLGNGVKYGGKRSWYDLDSYYHKWAAIDNEPWINQVINVGSTGDAKEKCQNYCDNLQLVKQRMVWCVNTFNVERLRNCYLGSHCKVVFG